MKFIADGMYGKLTRWLRMLGHNVKYSSSLDDAQLLKVAKKERRILLTRDFDLYEHAMARGVDAFFAEGETEEERLAELAKRFNIKLEIDMMNSRCPKCNTMIKPMPKEKAVGSVKENTLRHYNEFWKCPKCGQVYWQGAHWTRIEKTLSSAQQNLEKLKKQGS